MCGGNATGDAAVRLQACQSPCRDRRAERVKKLDAWAIRDAIAETDYQSIVGSITWKGGPLSPVPNVCTTPLVGGQWGPGKKWKQDLEIVFNKTEPKIPLFSAIRYPAHA